MANNQITPFQLTDQFTMDNFNQRINETNIALQKKVNPNLLDNWYFGNPVDQRGGYVAKPNVAYRESPSGSESPVGTTSGYAPVIKHDNYWYKLIIDGATYWVWHTDCVRGYVKTFEDGELYTIDRWMLTGRDATGATHLLVNDDSVTYEGAGNSKLSEIVNYKLSGKTVTGSVLCEAVTNCIMMLRNTYNWEPIGSVVMNAPGLHSFTATIPDDYGLDNVRLTFSAGSQGEGVAHSISIKAAKLELGSQQTLAHQDSSGNWQLNELPNYADTFLRCVSSTADPSDTYANVPQRRNNRVIAVNTVNGLTTTVYSNDVTVTISILGAPTTAIGANTALCDTLPIKYRPPIDYFMRILCDDSSSNIAGVSVGGIVTNPVAELTAGVYHRLIMTYTI